MRKVWETGTGIVEKPLLANEAPADEEIRNGS
jgi:hypothetical protein